MKEKNSKINAFRIKIDETDKSIVRLLNQRAVFAVEIGKIKRKLNLPVYTPSREEEVIRNVKSNNSGPLQDDAIQRLYERIIDESRRLEREYFSEDE
ncbi:MAG: chorismate mutase [Calditrichaceae bacterium]